MRRIEGLQAVINRMKEDQSSLSEAEGQLRAQIATLHKERAVLASDAAKSESTAKIAVDELEQCQKLLREAKDTIAILEKRIALSKKEEKSNVPRSKPLAAATERELPAPRKPHSQTQLLRARARSKNNNPPNPPSTHAQPAKAMRQIPKPKPAAEPQPPKHKQTPESTQSSDDEDEYLLDFDDDTGSEVSSNIKDGKNKDKNNIKSPASEQIDASPRNIEDSRTTEENKAIGRTADDRASEQVDKEIDLDDDLDQFFSSDEEQEPEKEVKRGEKTKNNKADIPVQQKADNTQSNIPKPLPPSAKTNIPRPRDNNAVKAKNNITTKNKDQQQPKDKAMGPNETPREPPSAIPNEPEQADAENQKKGIFRATILFCSDSPTVQVMAKWEADKKAQKQIEALRKKLSSLVFILLSFTLSFSL